jgi:hypothetical protein
MTFRLVRAEYVELRSPDDDGGEVMANAILSFKTTANLSKRRIEEDVVRKARRILKRAAAAT